MSQKGLSGRDSLLVEVVMDMSGFVQDALEAAGENYDLPLSSEEMSTYAVVAANRFSIASGISYPGLLWNEAYLRAMDILEVENRLHPEWEG